MRSQRVLLLTDVVRSEWRKLLGTRSTYWLIGGTVVVEILVGTIVSAAYASQYSTDFAARHTVDPTYWSLLGVVFGQLPLGVLGTLVMAGEYGNGLAATTFTAVPQRRVVITAKLLALTSLVMPVGLLASLGAFLTGQAQLHETGVSASLLDPAVMRAVLGAAADLTLVALLALALGALLRDTAGTIASVFALLIAVPGLGALLPPSWQESVVPYLPGNAGVQVLHVVPMQYSIPPLAGLACFTTFIAIALAAALLSMDRDLPTR